MSKVIRQGQTPKRQIKIKPIEVKQETVSNDEQAEQRLQSLNHQIESLKAEITQLEKIKNNIVQETSQYVENEKATLEEEKVVIREEAKQAGHAEGINLGKTEGKSLYIEKITEANQIVELVKEDYHKTLETTEEAIIDLAIHTAEKIILKKITDTPETFVGIVQEALKEIRNQPVISIYLHPKNYQFVIEQKTELKQILEKDTKLSLYVNEELPENACIIEHQFGQINANIDTQLSQIREALIEYVMESKS